MSDTNPVKLKTLEVNDAEDGLVVYDPSHDVVHHLNPSAAVIFDLCDGTRDPEEIAGVLAEVYGLQTPPVDEILVGLRDLVERQLISWNVHN
jgi:hypothetical protein